MTSPQPLPRPHLELLPPPARAASEATDQLRLIVETSPDLICVTEPDGRFRLLNPAFKAVLGYEPADLIGVQSTNFIHPDDLPGLEVPPGVGVAQAGEAEREDE